MGATSRQSPRRESSTIPARNLRPRKTIAVNKTLQKTTNNSKKGKKPLVVIDSLPSPIKKRVLKSTNKSVSGIKLRKSKQIEEVEVNNEKTHKKRKSSVISNNSNKYKFRRLVKKTDKSNGSTSLRQTTLKESFLHQTLVKSKRLLQSKNDSILLKQHLPPQQQDSVVVLEKMNLTDIKKMPIYKAAKTFDNSMENKVDIYDFKFDANDTKERAVKKKKRKNVKLKNVKKKSGKMMKKVVQKKAGVQSEVVGDKICETDPHSNSCVKTAQNNSPMPKIIETMGEKILEIPEVEIQNVEAILPSIERSAEQIKTQSPNKPKIISIENADNIQVSKTSLSKCEGQQSFCPTNIYNNKQTVQYKNTLNCSLLTKSLSPIMKILDSFDPGSPWRPPIPLFSHAKHFVQSTPNTSKIDLCKKIQLHEKNDFHSDDRTLNVSNIMPQNTNSLTQSTSDKTNHKKSSNFCRKFGTEITNIEPNSSIIQSNSAEIMNEKSTVHLEADTKPISNVQEVDTIAIETTNHQFEYIEDKENAIPNYQTPKPPTKKKLRKRYLSNLSPSKMQENKNNTQKENVDSQPGPSGIKKSSTCSEQRILQQSNLNNFLNLMNMPESTRINTKHGIFDDAHSTPISVNTTKKPNEPVTDLENAFGFCEKNSELNISPINDEFPNNQLLAFQAVCTDKSIVQPARLSLGEIKNRLVQKKVNDKKNKKLDHNHTKEINNDEKILDEKDNQVNKELVKQTNVKNTVNMVNFSDTFDLLSETEKNSNYENDMPLFMDLEPSYFSKPARHSYKRKRVVTFDFLEESDEEPKDSKFQTKKKKITKLEKETKKRLDEWAKTVNSTFQEIDEYDLLIE